MVRNCQRIVGAIARRRGCRVEPEAAGEHAESAEHSLFGVAEEVVAPREQRFERDLTCGSIADRAAQYCQAAIESASDCCR